MSELHFAHWGDDVVLFHEGSGFTHLVNSVGAMLLREVLVKPMTLDGAIESLAAAQNAQADEPFASQVAELIYRLETLGLIERITA